MALKKERPLSPHLTIYRPQISSMLSICHRISGVVNFVGLTSFLWWIVYVVFSNDNITKSFVWRFFTSSFGQLILILWSFSIFFHMCTGIRHLFWDFNIATSVNAVNKTGWIAIIMAILLTSSTWIIIFNVIHK